MVSHKQHEYVRDHVMTNTVEGYFGVFKLGTKGAYQHCSEKHLHRYLAEFNFRYSNCAKLGVSDAMRADRALAGIIGKRPTYQTTVQGKRVKRMVADVKDQRAQAKAKARKG